MFSANIGDPIIYWILRLILMATLIISGYGISKNEAKGSLFWKWATPSLIAYSLIQGLRYMRGADYAHYMGDLQGHLFTDYTDPLYLLWLNFFHFTGLPYPVGFVFYSFLLFFSFLLVVKHFPKTALWALPMFLLLTGSAENIIRQYFAICFIMFAFHFYLDKKKIAMLACLIACTMIHFSGIFAVVLFLFFAYFRLEDKSRIKKPWILIGLYIYLYYFFDVSYFKTLTDFLSKLNVGDNVAGGQYLNDADRWFSSDGSIQLVLGTKAAVVSKINQTVDFLSKLVVIWFGWFAMKNNKQLSVVYWFMYVALIIKEIGGDIEMYGRLYNWLVYLSPIMYGAIFYYCNWRKRWLKITVMAVFLITYGFYGFLRQLGQSGYAGCAFIWDA